MMVPEFLKSCEAQSFSPISRRSRREPGWGVRLCHAAWRRWAERWCAKARSVTERAQDFESRCRWRVQRPNTENTESTENAEKAVNMGAEKTILIVDDEPAARYGTRRALEGNHRMVEAESAAMARGAIASERPDLILLDLVMPGEDGLGFLRWLRENGNETPVIVVSALDTAKTAVEALQNGAADYVVKGFDIAELRTRVANVLKVSEL